MDFQVSASAILRNLENIHVGQNVYIAPNVVINAITSITLEDEVMIGFNSVLVSGNHTLVDGSYRYGKSKVKQIIIGKGSWIAANCTVIAGTKLAEGSLLAANSSISGEFVDTGIYGGVPARKIK
ncbi:acyltransferase [Rheinheimera sp. MM224]|uniref:acyltransferase n=1 Tax=Rheinheimera sp. MM224 TaxID=3019969 RepID=UPI0021F8A4FB|nr:acyltransferase [Rheinheimera sp. MM224]